MSRVTIVTVTLVALGLRGASAHAQRSLARRNAFDLQLFEPAPSPRSLVTVDLPAVPSHLTTTATLWGDFSDSLLRNGRGRSVVDDAVRGQLQLSLGLFQLFEVGVGLPVSRQGVATVSTVCTLIARGECPKVSDGETHTVLGDLRTYVKVPILRGRWPLALRLDVGFPTGNDEAFGGAAYWTLTPAVLAARDFGALTLALNLGVRLGEANASHFVSVNEQLLASLGVRYTLSQRVALIAEGTVRVNLNAEEAGYALEGSFVRVDGAVPAEAWLAARVGIARGLSTTVGGGLGLGDAPGSPGFRVFGALRYSYEARTCTTGPEDLDGYADSDFCADPDNDGDGIEDESDRCPNDAEDRDGVLDGDGCPDPDNDGDGVLDDVDRCPIEPEDHDRFQNDDGCPDLDNDHDGLADVIDVCPDEAEDRDNYQDDDGCSEPGPDAVVVTRTDSRLLVSQRIYFDYDSDTIRDVSHPILNEVASAIARNPDITRLRIEGHTDQAGTPEYNLDLSFRRARSVMEYLASRGVARERLEFQGYGQTRPVAQPGAADAEALNRRVEFMIVQTEAASATPSTVPATTPASPERRHYRRRHGP